MGYQLVTYRNRDRDTRAGVDVAGRIYNWADLLRHASPASRAQLDGTSTVLEILGRWQFAAAALEALCDDIHRLDLEPLQPEHIQLRAPILYPPGVFCSGPNYTCHLSEMTKGQRTDIDKTTARPFFFSKPATHTIIGTGAPIELPRIAAKVDWEAELAVVIGCTACDVSVDRAMEHVAGYTIMNDVSARDLFQRDEWAGWKDWLACKGFESSAPLGPGIVPASQIANPYELTIKLWVNDELQQDSSTSRMVFSIAEQIAFLSERVTLRPGDVIATGTPAGVGMAKGRFLATGDTVRIEIAQLGVLENPVVGRGTGGRLSGTGGCLSGTAGV